MSASLSGPTLGPSSFERLFVERLYDFYQAAPTRVERRSNRCLISQLALPRLAVQGKRTTDL
ncbi:hypothetical protein CBZ_21670 [Cellulomonas biazotea]|jgi:hypothetical protein|uniref:Uncharacterized protein n=1 Tax=Cellulomonas biazotea TaxID=1709 RepID=A0A402DSM4_9CELL|nr:hypothetical protein CBZ_21670 [Cellulomonas biazotea]